MAENSTPVNSLNPLNGQKIGLFRRIWRSRKWYGAEWYITGFGGLILVLILLMALFAPNISPYDPNAFVGAPFTKPGQGSQTMLARAGESPVLDPEQSDLVDLTIGVQRNQNGKKVADAYEANAMRFMTEDELLTGLENGTVDYIFVDDELVPEILDAHPDFEVCEPLPSSFCP